MVINISKNKLALSVVTFIVVYHMIIDSLNGFFLIQLGISVYISIVSKLILFLVGGYILLKNRRGHSFILLFLFIAIFFIFPPILRFFVESRMSFLDEIMFAFKYLLFIFCMVLFISNYEGTSREDIIKKMFVVSFLAISFNVILGYLGWGFYTYKATSTGFKGFYIAGNELSAVFIVVSTFLLCEIFILKRYFIYVLISSFLMFISLSLGTKSTLISIAFIIVSAPIIIYLFSGKLKWLPLYGLGCLSVVSCILFNLDLFMNFDSIQRILVKVNKLDYLAVIFSGREVWAESMYVYLQNNSSAQNILLGSGLHTVEIVLSGKSLVESDVFDILNMFGLISLVFCLLVAIFFVLYPLFRPSRPYAPHVFIVNVLLLTFAIITGHVWTSGMLAISWAGLNSLIFIKRSK